MQVNWLVQSPDKPLFPDILWSRPENRSAAGKLLVIGGGGGDLAVVSQAYSSALQSGAGTLRLLVPKSLEKLTKMIPEIEYAPATPAGSFGMAALAEILVAAHGVDGVLLAGDLSKNSETSLLLEKFIAKYNGLLVVAREAIESVHTALPELLDRPSTIIFLSDRELRDLAISLKSVVALTSDMPSSKYADLLRSIARDRQTIFVCEREGDAWVASGGNLAQSKQSLPLAATSATWAIQQPEKLFQSIVTSLATTN